MLRIYFNCQPLKMSSEKKIFHFCFLFGLFLSACVATFDVRGHKNWPKDLEKVCGISYDSDRIIGGTEAGLGQFPWQAGLMFSCNYDF